MKVSRREFLSAASALGLGACTYRTAYLPGGGPRPEQLRSLAAVALEAARRAGASYADVRVNRYRTQRVSVFSRPEHGTGRVHHVPRFQDAESFGFGVRVLAKGAWGFAASDLVTSAEVARVAAEAAAMAHVNAALRRTPVRLAPAPPLRGAYRTPMSRDPFRTPIDEKLALLRGVNEEVKRVPGVFAAFGFLALRVEHRSFASTEGSELTQDVYQTLCSVGGTAVERGRKSKRRIYGPHANTGGWEVVERARMREQARRIGEEAVAHLRAPSVAAGKKDLVLLPSHLALTIHESLGHSTELDRALGWEADFAGTSFLTPDKLGKFRVGAEIVDVHGDRTRAGSLATCAWDDDGVKTVAFPILRKGIFVGYQTTRDQAHLIGQKASTGCAYADSWASVPFQRMPNVSLAPSPSPVALADLVAGVDDGILIDGMGSYSIDHQRYNFQFGGNAFWEIRGGKVRGMIADVAYQSRTPDFWQACDGLGGAATWEDVGLFGDGKGQPTQVNRMSHGCPPARFRRVDVLRTG